VQYCMQLEKLHATTCEKMDAAKEVMAVTGKCKNAINYSHVRITQQVITQQARIFGKILPIFFAKFRKKIAKYS